MTESFFVKLEEVISCAVCCKIFKDPVTLHCNHSFCKSCLSQQWEEKGAQECPACKRRASIEKPLVNFTLKNIAESYLMSQKSPPSIETVCRKHQEKPKLFCLDEEKLICVVCQTSKEHAGHQVIPVEEAVLEYKEQLKTALPPLQDKLGKFKKIQFQCNTTVQIMRKQIFETERQIQEEFEKLHQFLRDEEKARIAALRGEEEQKGRIMKEKIEKLTREISSLSDTIRVIEQEMEAEDIFFLQKYKDTQRRYVRCGLSSSLVLY
ncbi:zinc-binding protein A33-like [Acipenser oxyrinchus oxyrinchus]|uniref:Zinc-binding protein A33-like n=1 Tax=Acipenser oxyrinchus oxyrinchus TaxID=40147 RepID=A0AAD8CLA4_ACIOX|nr:zinc-binding protein A33-like [Acipenser oxyrinchus oxyrinchus]